MKSAEGKGEIMKHESYERIVPGSDTAVLFLHGILGTPRHFEDFISLVPDSWSFSAPLLPGQIGRASCRERV